MSALGDGDDSESAPRAVRALCVPKLALTVLVLALTLARALGGGPL
jgi:hypothetical protein